MTELITGKTLPNVVVTGVAMTTALATDAETTWKLLLDSQSGIRRLEDSFVEEFDLPVRIGGHLLEEFDSRIDPRRAAPDALPAADVHRSGPAGLGEHRLTRGRHATGCWCPSAPAWARPKSSSSAMTTCARVGIKAVYPLGGPEVHAQRRRRGGGAGAARQGRGVHPGVGVRVGF